MPGASWLIRIQSLVLKSKNGVSSSKIGLTHRSNTGLPTSGEFVTSSGHTRDNGYLELSDSRHLGDYELGSMRTEIRGGGAVSRTLDEGVRSREH